MTVGIPPLCAFCANFESVTLEKDLKCKAFDVVPIGIVVSTIDHRKPVAGDRGIQFEQDPKVAPAPTAAYDQLFEAAAAGVGVTG